MIQLKVLSGKKAGASWVARRFPVRIGRAANADLRLEEEGVWEQHLKLDFKPAQGVVLLTQPNALARVNGQAAQETLLQSGDLIELGSLKLQFWLSEPQQKSLAWREALVWAGLAALCLGQVALVYWLSS